jgi:hypothetical protein
MTRACLQNRRKTDDGFRVSDDGGGPKNIYAGGKDWMIA